MRDRVFVRPAKAEDVEKFYTWSVETENNEFDPEIAKAQSTITLCAYDKQGPLVYMPLQQPFFLESAAIRPGASASEIAVAFRALIEAAVTQAHIQQRAEIYFLGSEEGTDKLAQNQLFEHVDMPVYRLKIKDLER
jgi:hypothetical protein